MEGVGLLHSLDHALFMPTSLRDAFDHPVSTIVLAEGEFGDPGGKTANGVVMHSEIFAADVIIDSETAGQSAADVLENPSVDDIPIVDSMDAALENAPNADALVIGVAPAGGSLPSEWVADIKQAVRAGCDVVSGLHVFLNDQQEWRDLAAEHDVRLFDVRKPPTDNDLRVGDGRVDEIDVPVVLVMGTDCAVGKRTTTFELYQAATEAGFDAAWVATGQTGIMIGAHEGVVIDRVPADFTAGVVEDLVSEAAKNHDIVFVEGQAALTHRAYSAVTLGILHGAWPDAVVLADDPNRDQRTHFEQFSVDGVASEIATIETIAETSVVAISTWGDPDTVAEEHGLPAANVYHKNGAKTLLNAIREAL